MSMKKLYTFGLHDGPLAEALKERLENEGVKCVLRNQQLFAALGEIPFTECFPELWLVDAETWPRAHALLDQWLGDGSISTSWTCPGCHETIDPPFARCWRCGCEHP